MAIHCKPLGDAQTSLPKHERIEYRTLPSQKYLNLCAEILLQLESSGSPRLHVDKKGIVTSGGGVNLRDNRKLIAPFLNEFKIAEHSELAKDLEKIFRTTYGPSANISLRNDVASVLRKHNHARTDLDLTREQAIALIKQVIQSQFERDLSISLANNCIEVPPSFERASLMSLYYNYPPLVGDGLRRALRNGDRVAAWREIRYRSNLSKEHGVTKRRLIEAHIFGHENEGPRGVAGAAKKPTIDAAYERAYVTFKAINEANAELAAIEKAVGYSLGRVNSML